MPSNIKFIKLKEVANISAGGDKPKNFSLTKTDKLRIPVFSNGETNSGLQGYTDVARVKEPSVTISARGTIGYAALRNKPFTPIVRLLTLTPKKNQVNLNYLYYNLMLNRQKGFGSSQAQITVPDISETEILLHDIRTQENIGDVLLSLDRKVKTNNTIIEKLNSLLLEYFDYWFMQFDYPNLIGEPYKASGGKLEYSNSLKRRIPAGWQVVKIGDILRGSSGSKSKIESGDILSSGMYPVITQDTGGLVTGYTNESNPNDESPVIVFGDHSCTIRYVNFPFFQGADGTQIMRMDEHLVDYLYLYLLKVIPKIPGYGKYERHYKYVKDLKLALPEDKLLHSFISITSPILKLINKKHLENNYLEGIRNWLLPLLMSGNVVIDE